MRSTLRAVPATIPDPFLNQGPTAVSRECPDIRGHREPLHGKSYTSSHRRSTTTWSLGRDFDPPRIVVSLWYHFAPWLRHQEKIRKPNSRLPLSEPVASKRRARPRAPADASGKMHLTTEGTDLHREDSCLEPQRRGGSGIRGDTGGNAFNHGRHGSTRKGISG